MSEKCEITKLINEYEFNRNNEYCIYNHSELKSILISKLKKNYEKKIH